MQSISAVTAPLMYPDIGAKSNRDQNASHDNRPICYTTLPVSSHIVIKLISSRIRKCSRSFCCDGNRTPTQRAVVYLQSESFILPADQTLTSYSTCGCYMYALIRKGKGNMLLSFTWKGNENYIHAFVRKVSNRTLHGAILGGYETIFL